MTSLSSLTAATPGRPEQVSTRIAFFIAGFAIASWAPLVPLVQLRTGLDDGMLGLLLLCLGLGSIVAMPVVGMLAGRFGCRDVLVVAALLVALVLPLLAVLSDPLLLAVALALFGAGIGSVDCVVNMQAVIVERASGRSMMSGFHGLWSLGGILGSAGVSALFGLGAPPLLAAGSVAACVLVALVVATPHLLTHGGEASGPRFAVPRGVVLLIGGLCFVVFLTEGSVLDWSAVFLTQARGVDAVYAGLGYTAFSLTMTAGRLTGDAIVQRLGGTRVMVLGGFCAAAGLALATLVPAWQVGLLGYALVGAGCANIVPVLFTAVGRQTVMPEAVAVPAITTLGYAGILLGPALIGLVTRAASLSVAFLILAVLLLGVAGSARFLRD